MMMSDEQRGVARDRVVGCSRVVVVVRGRSARHLAISRQLNLVSSCKLTELPVLISSAQTYAHQTFIPASHILPWQSSIPSSIPFSSITSISLAQKASRPSRLATQI